MEHPAYELSLPEVRTTSTIFASPHSGRNYPLGFLKRSVLDERAIRSSEDAFVDLLVAAVAEVNDATVLHHDHDFERIAAVTGQPTRWVDGPPVA